MWMRVILYCVTRKLWDSNFKQLQLPSALPSGDNPVSGSGRSIVIIQANSGPTIRTSPSLIKF